MFGTMNELWLGFAAEGVVTEAEYRAMTLPQYYKSVAEVRAPFDDVGGPVRAAGLRLEACETRAVPCPFAAAFRVHRDVERFAREYIPTLRNWSEGTFAGALDPARPEEEWRAIVARFWQGHADRVRAAPQGHGMDYVHVYMTIARTTQAR